MRWKYSTLFIFVIFIFVLFTSILFWYLEDSYESGFFSLNDQRKIHLLCVLLPYRDRFAELQRIIPHLSSFLTNQSIDHLLIVLNQTDNYRFNRAALINVGWLEADRLNCDYMCMHDVDLLPLNPELNYSYPGHGIVKHISAGKYHPIIRYDYKKFIGGILMLTMDDFKRVNGMSNKYWGWGLEDDEFYLRLRDANLSTSIVRPENLTTDRTNTFKHIHGKSRKRDYAVVGNQKKISHQRDRVSGLRTVQYTIRGRSFLTFGHVRASVVNVDLVCDMDYTPYCILPSGSHRNRKNI